MAQENLTALKTLVFSMGLLLMACAAFTVGAIWSHAPKTESAFNCPGGHVSLKGRGIMIDSAVDGHVMRVTLQKGEDKNETVLLDLCTGKEIGSLSVETDAGTSEE